MARRPASIAIGVLVAGLCFFAVSLVFSLGQGIVWFRLIASTLIFMLVFGAIQTGWLLLGGGGADERK